MTATASQRTGAVLLLTTLALLGCVDVTTTTRIEPGGSGTFAEVVVVDLKAAAALRAAFKQRGSGAGEEEAPRLRSLLTALDPSGRIADLREANGVTSVTATSTSDNERGTRTYSLTGRFRSLEALFASDIIEDMEGALRPAREGKAWVLSLRHVFDDDELDAADRKTTLAVRKKLLAPFAKHLAGFRIRRTMHFPTRVLESNGVIDKSGRTVTWTVGMDALLDPRRLRQTVTFQDAAGLSLKSFGEQTPPSEDAPARAGTDARKPPSPPKGKRPGKAKSPTKGSK